MGIVRKIFSLVICLSMVVVLLTVTKPVQASEQYLWPVPGTTTDDITGNYEDGHHAIDIGVGTGNQILATKSGTVIRKFTGCNNVDGANFGCSLGICELHDPFYYNGKSYCNQGFGNGIVLQHDDGTFSYYAHLISIQDDVVEGRHYPQGTLLGLSGSTGCSYAHHLHFAVSTSFTLSDDNPDINPEAISYIYEVPAPPTDATISISKSEVAVGENVTFTFSAPDNPTNYSLVINDGVNNEVIDCGQNTSYTKSFSKPGDYYSAYIVAEYGIIGYLNSNNIGFRVVGPPTNAAISMSRSEIPVGTEVQFYFSATNATGYVIGIDKAGTRIETKDCGGNKSYTRSFSEYGSYSAYVTAYNGAGSVDSMKIDFTVSPYDFDIMDGEAAIRGYSGPGGNITIPNTLGGAPVTSIGYMAFSQNTSLTGIEMHDGITNIGEYAFDGCIGLTTVSIPEGVTYLGEGAFSGCSGLSEISLPVGITSIGEHAFSACEGLTSVSLPAGISSIGGYAFCQCTSLTSISLPTGISTINESVFGDCQSLTNISIPQGVTSIGNFAFMGCSSLSGISLPEGLVSIGEGVFYDCQNLLNISIPQGVTSIGNQTFSGCTSLTSISLPEGLASIGDRVFYKCKNLSYIDLPQGVLSIGDEAFLNCEKLSGFDIPQSILSLGSNVFNGCRKLNSISVDANNLYYSSIDGVLYDKSLTTLIDYPAAKTGAAFSIPQTVTSIEDSALMFNNSLNTISIPQGVTSIGQRAFAWCGNLNRITVDAGNLDYVSIDGVLYDKPITILLTYPAGINSSTFSIPQTVTNIGDFAFAGNYWLTNISIPAEIINIGSYAFGSCQNLASITFESPNTYIYDEEYANIGEYTINRGATIIGHDPSTAKDYAAKYGRTFQIIGSASNDATLSDLSVEGTTIPGFYPARTEYSVVLPAGTTVVPTVTASVNDTGGATAEITPAASLPGTTIILVTAADGITTEIYSISFTVVLPVTVTPASPNVEIEATPLQITVPADVNNASLKTSPIDGVVTIPQVSVQSSTDQGNVEVNIADGTEVTGPTDWDGTINLPQVVDTGSVTFTPENGYEVSVSGAIEIGLPDTTLNFSQPVRIMLAGQGGKKAGWILNETFTPITYEMASDTAEALEANPDGYITVGSDLVIWTTHFTTFVAYTEIGLPGYTLSGQVLVEGDDLTEGQPHYSGGVNIELKQGEEIKYTTTSSEAQDLVSNGTFSLTGIADGDYTVVISKAGYLTRSFALTINSDLTLSTSSNQYLNRIYLLAGDIVSDEYNVIAASDVNYILSKFNSNSTQAGFDPQVDIVKDQYNVISAADVNLMLSNFNQNSTQYPDDVIY